MANKTVDDKVLYDILDRARKIVNGEAPYSRNRQTYLENVVEKQIEIAQEIRDILEDNDIE